MDTNCNPTNKIHISKENNFNRKLICINYPGIVKNVDKMLDTLGGLPEIEHAISERNRNLELRFRPDDKFSKPVLSDTDKKPGVLIKVIKREIDGKQEYNCEVLGVNTLSYSFNRYCDFQYLPLVTNEEESKETPLRCISEDLQPRGIPTEDWLSKDKNKEMPPFLPAGMFSRFDYQQINNMFNRKSSNLFPSRSKAPRLNVIVSFDNESVPDAPPESILQFIEMKPSMKANYEQVKKLFEERPIWSKAAILHMLNMKSEHGKYILPGVGYFNKNGPWRSMWTRYSYDPRKDPSAKIYQTFDFRIRSTKGLKEIVKHKRATFPLNENNYMLKPGLLPAGRQAFYQYCDVKLPEIEAMLKRLPPIPSGTKCDIKNGWLPDKFNDQCREIANKYIEETVQKQLEEARRKNPIENQEKAIENIIDVLEISDTESELSDFEIIYNEFNSDNEEVDKPEEDSEEDIIDKEAADEVARFIGTITQK